jgi:FHA domain
MGTLRLSTGVVVSLDRSVLLGRAPKARGATTGSHGPHLLRLDSRANDISRNHVEVFVRGRHVMVRDLGSTNGTTVALPGQEPMRMRPNDLREIEPGMVVALADEVSFTIELQA